MDGLSRNPRYLNDEWFSRKLVWRVNRYQQSENIGNKSYCEKKLGTRASCYLDGNFSRKNKVQISCVAEFCPVADICPARDFDH